jgi:KaiC/GvpD/RAD55 family RecA-like ATPase
MIESYRNILRKDIDRDSYAKILRHIKLRITDKYSSPPEILWVNELTIGTLGNFSASVGKPKSKKTFNVCAIVAAALSGQTVLNYRCSLPEGHQKVLYIDTEQSKGHCHKVMRRIFKMANLPTDTESDSLEFLMLREYSPKQRRQIIECALELNPNTGLMVIDGLRDLLLDINSPAESVEVISDLMRWTSVYNMHIHTVLHTNKDNENTRGHIGTELNNKAETIIHVNKNEFEANVSEVKAMHSREKEFAPFAFRVNADGLPELESDYAKGKVVQKTTIATIPDEEHQRALAAVFKSGAVATYGDLINALQTAYAGIGQKRGRNFCVKLNKHLMSRKIIVKGGDGYTYNPDAWDKV